MRRGGCKAAGVVKKREKHMYIADSKRLTMSGAKKMMETAIQLAEEAKFAVTVAIADAGGHLMLLERMDGGRFHTVHSSTTKAICAASNKRPTSARGAQARAPPPPAGTGTRTPATRRPRSATASAPRSR